MSLIRLDPEKNFKWTAYPPAQPLSSSDDMRLKKFTQLNYVDLINSTLGFFKLRPCAGKVVMITELVTPSKTIIDNPLFGTYKIDDVTPKLKSSVLSEEATDRIEALYYEVSNNLNLPADINDVKQKFKDCASNNLFVVALTAFPLRKLPPGESVYVSHANILVIAKNLGKVYWIEPETTGSPAYEEKMKSSIKVLVNEIGLRDPEVVIPNTTCPQGLTNDTDCMFWSYVIFTLIMLNPQEKDHNVLIRNFMEKYPTKEALSQYINGFKTSVLSSVPSSGATRKRTIKKKNHKKRRTYRRK
jgi:hypothetical protein